MKLVKESNYLRCSKICDSYWNELRHSERVSRKAQTDTFLDSVQNWVSPLLELEPCSECRKMLRSKWCVMAAV